MKKLLSAIFLITLVSTASFAMDQAEPLDFIFLAGDYKEELHITLETHYKSGMPGPDGGTITFAYPTAGELPYVSTDEGGVESYAAPAGFAEAVSDVPGFPAAGYSLGVLYEPTTSTFAWFLDDVNGNRDEKLWVRELTEEEYGIIGLQTTITARAGSNAILIQYAGTEPGTNDVALEITDADAPEKFTKLVITSDRIPGYINLPCGAILLIEKVVTADGVPVLYYDWSKEPAY